MRRVNIIWGIWGMLMLASCQESDNGFDASGTFEATEVIISAQGNGEIIEFSPIEGDMLSAGQVVALVDTVQLALKREQLQFARKAIVSRFSSDEVQLESLRSTLSSQEKEHKRFGVLYSNGAATKKQVDDLAAAVQITRGKIAAQSEVVSNTNRSLMSEASSLEMQIRQIDEQIKRCYTLSPIAGTMLTKYAEQGEFAQLGKPMFKVADIENIYLRAYVTEPQLAQVRLGQSVSVYTDMGESYAREYVGSVTWISSEAEFTPKTIQTKEQRRDLVYAIKVAIKNDGYIKIGMYGDLKF